MFTHEALLPQLYGNVHSRVCRARFECGGTNGQEDITDGARVGCLGWKDAQGGAQLVGLPSCRNDVAVAEESGQVRNTWLFVEFAWRSGLQDLAFAHNCNAVDRKSTRLNSSHVRISYAVFCL